jgi:hypothetical protein
MGCVPTRNLRHASPNSANVVILSASGAFADLEAFFSSLDNVLAFQGSCQGPKDSQAFWLAVSAFLVYMLHWLGHVAHIILAMSRSVLEVVSFLFVDDTDLMTVAKIKLETPTQVMSRMQDAVNAWHGG